MRELEEHHEARGALHQRADRRALVAPELEVSFPVTWNRAILGLRGSLPDRDHVGELPARLLYSNPEVDRLLDLGPRTVDEDERRAIYAQIQEILWADQPWIYLYFVRQIAVGAEPLDGVIDRRDRDRPLPAREMGSVTAAFASRCHARVRARQGLGRAVHSG